jgi:LiaF transmembrane domain
MPRSHRSGSTARLVLGLFVIAVGVVFTLDQMKLVRAEDYLHYWPLVFIVLGLVKLLQARAPVATVGAVVWIAAGALLLASSLGYLPFDPVDFWPLVLVVLGVRLVARARPSGRVGDEGGGEISAVAVMAGVKRASRAPDFRGGDLVAVMGGCEIDLRQAAVAGEEAVIDVIAVWGGIEIRVPESWTVTGKVLPILGGFEDKTQPPAGAAGGRLLVKGVAVMGGVEVRN